MDENDAFEHLNFYNGSICERKIHRTSHTHKSNTIIKLDAYLAHAKSTCCQWVRHFVRSYLICVRHQCEKKIINFFSSGFGASNAAKKLNY